MTKEQLLKISVLCERCKDNPAVTVKGGIIAGVRGLWMLCVSCQRELRDERKQERRK